MTKIEELIENCLKSGEYRRQKVINGERVIWCVLLFDYKEGELCPFYDGVIMVEKEDKQDVSYIKCNPAKFEGYRR